MVRTLASPALALLLSGCIPWGLALDGTDPPWIEPIDTGQAERPTLVVSPSTLTFDVAASDGPVTRTLTFTNEGDVAATVYDTAPVAGDGIFANADPLSRPVRVPAGGTASLSIVFSPPHGGRFEDRIDLQAPSANGVESVPLVGTVSGPTPRATSDTVTATLQWCTRAATVLLRNDGPDAMPVYDLRLVARGEQRGCGSFRIPPEQAAALKDTPIADGELRTVELEFVPVEPGPQTCTLEVDTALAQPVRVNLAGEGTRNPRARETWFTSDGTDAHVLLIHDDGALDVNDHRSRLSDGLDDLLRALDIVGVEYRIAAPSTEDGCAIGSPRWGQPDDGTAVVLETLRRNLFTPQTTLADQPLRLLSEVFSGDGASCFPGWLKRPDPLHVVFVSVRGDASGRSVASWLGDVKAEVPDLTVSAIVPRSGCGPTATRLEQAVRDTGGTLYDLCSTDWDRHWLGIAEDTAGLRAASYARELLATPLPGSLRVAVDRVATERWTLGGPDGRTLTLEPVWPDGSEVQVDYADEATCR